MKLNLSLSNSLFNPMLHPKTLILYPADNVDGFGAAFSAWVHFGAEAEYVSCHNNLVPNVAVQGRDVFILGTHFEPGIMQLLLNEVNSLTLIDKHRTAKDKFDGMTLLNVCHPTESPSTEDASNSLNAWKFFKFFNSITAVPFIISKIEHYQQALGGIEFNLVLEVMPRDFAVWQTVTSHEIMRLFNLQRESGRLSDRIINNQFSAARPLTLLGYEGLWTEGPKILSTFLGYRLAEQSEAFGIVVYAESKHTLKFCLTPYENSISREKIERIIQFYGGAKSNYRYEFSIPCSLSKSILGESVKPLDWIFELDINSLEFSHKRREF
jgi:hypothetical protein